MSFVRYLALGFFDHDAVKEHQLILRRPWQPEEVQRFADEIGGKFTPDAEVIVDGRLVLKLYNGYLIYLFPVPAPKDIGLLERLVEGTGCDIADSQLGFLLNVEDLRSLQKSLASALSEAKTRWPLGEELERAHRELVEKSRRNQQK